MPRVLIIAGPNGSGKSTFARSYILPHMPMPFLNADDMARELSPGDPGAARMAAGRNVTDRSTKLAEAGENFAIETTLAGTRYLRVIARWRATGYHVTLYFMWIPEIAVCLERISDRVRKGGHDVPERDVRRRYERGIVNLPACCEEADWCLVFDNSGATPSLINEMMRSNDANPI